MYWLFFYTVMLLQKHNKSDVSESSKALCAFKDICISQHKCYFWVLEQLVGEKPLFYKCAKAVAVVVDVKNGVRV